MAHQKVERRRPHHERMLVWGHLIVLWRALPPERRVHWQQVAVALGVSPDLFTRMQAHSGQFPLIVEIAPELPEHWTVTRHEEAVKSFREKAHRGDTFVEVNPLVALAVTRTAERRAWARVPLSAEALVTAMARRKPASAKLPAIDYTMTRTCSWCKTVLYQAAAGAETTHTICDACLVLEAAAWVL